MQDDGKLLIDEGLALLAPADDADQAEKEAFQTFINDIFRWGAAFKAGKTRLDIYRDSASYFAAHRRELDILLDIFTRGAHGVVDVFRFKYFDVTKLSVDKQYVQVLLKVHQSMQ